MIRTRVNSSSVLDSRYRDHIRRTPHLSLCKLAISRSRPSPDPSIRSQWAEIACKGTLTRWPPSPTSSHPNPDRCPGRVAAIRALVRRAPAMRARWSAASNWLAAHGLRVLAARAPGQMTSGQRASHSGRKPWRRPSVEIDQGPEDSRAKRDVSLRSCHP